MAARRVEPPRLAEPMSVAGAEREGRQWWWGRGRGGEREGAKPPSNNEQQIAMGTRSSPLLPGWTNRELAAGFKTWRNIYAFIHSYPHTLISAVTFITAVVIHLCNIEVIYSISVFPVSGECGLSVPNRTLYRDGRLLHNAARSLRFKAPNHAHPC